MGRSNNQRRKTAKAKGLAFIPGWCKSKTKRMNNKMALKSQVKKGKKLPYKKVVDKAGKVKNRRFSSTPRKGPSAGGKK
jgi:hypothetical protein